jgi:hypothetical protein
MPYKERYINRKARFEQAERELVSLSNEYSEDYNPPEEEVWNGCVRATNNAGASELLLTQIGMNLLHEQKADYVTIRNVRKAQKELYPICGMPEFSEGKFKKERRFLNMALSKVRKCKTSECRERRLAKVNKRFANSPARWGRQRCFCGDVVLTRFDISRQAIRLKRGRSRARTIPREMPLDGGANYWMAE